MMAETHLVAAEEMQKAKYRLFVNINRRVVP